eukprot:19514_1
MPTNLKIFVGPKLGFSYTWIMSASHWSYRKRQKEPSAQPATPAKPTSVSRAGVSTNRKRKADTTEPDSLSTLLNNVRPPSFPPPAVSSSPATPFKMNTQNALRPPLRPRTAGRRTPQPPQGLPRGTYCASPGQVGVFSPAPVGSQSPAFRRRGPPVFGDPNYPRHAYQPQTYSPSGYGFDRPTIQQGGPLSQQCFAGDLGERFDAESNAGLDFNT